MLCLLVEALYSWLMCPGTSRYCCCRYVVWASFMADVCLGTSGYCCCRYVVWASDALPTKTLIHHILGPVHSGFEPKLEFPEREPQKILWFWIWGRNPERNAIFSSDSGNIFILEKKKRLSKLLIITPEKETAVSRTNII